MLKSLTDTGLPKRINSEYSSENTQADASTKAANKARNSKIIPELKNLIKNRLRKTWSPEEIVGREAATRTVTAF